MDKRELGNAIKQRRQQLGIGQETLAGLAQIGINTIVSIERGQGNPKLDTILSLVNVLGLNLAISK